MLVVVMSVVFFSSLSVCISVVCSFFFLATGISKVCVGSWLVLFLYSIVRTSSIEEVNSMYDLFFKQFKQLQRHHHHHPHHPLTLAGAALSSSSALGFFFFGIFGSITPSARLNFAINAGAGIALPDS
jgi:4-amino-4-deoxy-L-arabinose transferase-like glycosyltransferase